MMWCQTPPPLTNRWLLHIAATTGQVGAVLREMCIDDQQPHSNGDEQFPVYLRGVAGPYGPPEWMNIAHAEFNRRGYPTRWCTPRCRHHPWPPRTEPDQPTTTPIAARSGAAAGPAWRRGPRTPMRRLTSGAAPPHTHPGYDSRPGHGRPTPHDRTSMTGHP